MITKPTIYTEEFVLNELNDMMTEIIEDKDIFLLGELFETRSYHYQRYSEWDKAFKDNKEISDTIKRIKHTLEYRLNKRGLEGKSNAAMTIFNLKNNYDWKDKTEVENKNFDMSTWTEEELNNREKELKSGMDDNNT